MRLWERICQTLGEDLRDFGREFARITEDLQGFVRLWERICKISCDFGRGFTSIHEKLGEDSQGL